MNAYEWREEEGRKERWRHEERDRGKGREDYW